MMLSTTAQKAVKKIDKALGKHNLSEQEKAEILQIIGKSLMKTVEETTDTHNQAMMFCCGPEADLAHKIEEEVERKKIALIANLKALR
jgi:hypothetical protein